MKNKLMKTMAVVAMATTVLACMMMTGCAKETPDAPANGGSDVSTPSGDNNTAVKGYTFESNGVTIAVDMDIKEVVDDLGDTVNYFEQPSCAAEGIAKIYTYASYEVQTYPDKDVDRVACIILKDDNVATKEGADLSMTKSKIIEIYGDDYSETDTCIKYEKDGMSLQFILDGEDLLSIEYDSAALN